MIYRLKPQKVLKIAVFLSILQVIIGFISTLSWRLGFRNALVFYFRKYFLVSVENTIPTWFSSILLFLCAVSLLLVWTIKSKTNDRYKYHWLGLSLIFLLFSADEVAEIHEKLGSAMVQNTIGQTSGLFYYEWVISGLVFVALFSIIFFNFWKHLPGRTRWLFLISGVIFISGALGAEMMSAQQAEKIGGGSIGGMLWTSLEEGCEMIGVSLFLYSILMYIQSSIGSLSLQIGAHPFLNSASELHSTMDTSNPVQPLHPQTQTPSDKAPRQIRR